MTGLQQELAAVRELLHELQGWSSAAAQELQETIDEAEEAGCTNPCPTAQALLDDHQRLMVRMGLCDPVEGAA